MDIERIPHDLFRYLGKTFWKLADRISWVVENMDLTQWGIVAAVFVFLGFLALKSKS